MYATSVSNQRVIMTWDVLDCAFPLVASKEILDDSTENVRSPCSELSLWVDGTVCTTASSCTLGT